MELYSFLRQWLRPGSATMVMALWYGVLITLVFLGLSQVGIDLRYANM